jgi:hypothetical protein
METETKTALRVLFDKMPVERSLHCFKSLPAEFVSMTPDFMEPRLKFRLPNGHFMTFFCGCIVEPVYKADLRDKETGDVYNVLHLNREFPIGEELPLGYVQLSHRYYEKSVDPSVHACIKFRHPSLGLRAATVTELLVHSL